MARVYICLLILFITSPLDARKRMKAGRVFDEEEIPPSDLPPRATEARNNEFGKRANRGGFVIPTPYIPNHGADIFDDYEYLFPFPDALPCEQRKRCERRNEEFVMDLRDQNCFCDPMCVVYADCCVDYEPEVNIPEPEITIDPSSVSCRVVHEIDRENPILFVDKCPRDTEDDYLFDQCDRFYSNDGFLNLPVSGNKSGVLYKNVYCAICWGEMDFSFWQAEYQCLSGPDGYRNQLDASQALQETINDPHGCALLYRNEAHIPRYCKPDVISKCDRDFNDRRIKRRCRSDSDTSYVYHNRTHIYKNIYCAKCNNVSESHTSCVDDITRPIKRPLMPESLPVMMPFSLLIDINTGRGKVSVTVGSFPLQSGYRIDEYMVDFRKCAEHHVYDPFSRMCRMVGCTEGEVFERALCVPKTERQDRRPKLEDYDYDTLITPNPGDLEIPTDSYFVYSEVETGFEYDYTSRDFGCPKISYPYSEYAILPNQSVLIQSSGELFDQGHYDIVADTVFVCSPEVETSESKFDNTFSVNNGTDGSVQEEIGFIMFRYTALQRLISVINLIVSKVSLLTVWFVYVLLSQLRSATTGRCIISLVTAMFFEQLLLIIGVDKTNMPVLCTFIGTALHYLILVCFFWVNVIALDMCTFFTAYSIRLNAEKSCSRFLFYSIYAWLTPAILVGGSVALDMWAIIPDKYRPHYAEEVCWLARKDALFYLFALPIGVILTINFILFVVTTASICAIRKTSKSAAEKRKKVGQFVLCVLLGFIMGLTWVSAFAATLFEYYVLWYVFIGLNALQGLFICLAFVCNRYVLSLIAGLGKPTKRKMAIPGSYYACPNGSANGSMHRHLGYLDPNFQMELESHETSI